MTDSEKLDRLMQLFEPKPKVVKSKKTTHAQLVSMYCLQIQKSKINKK